VAYSGAGDVLQLVQQLFRAQHRASQGIADANGQRRNVRLTFLHDIEMRVEGRGLEHLGEGKPHLVGQRGKVGCGNLMISVLKQMEMLDQQVAPPRPIAEQKFDLMRRRGIDLAALGGRFGPPTSLTWMFEGADLLHVMTHRHLDSSISCGILVRGIPNAKQKQLYSL
jgi:hypothetical protein